MACNVPPAIPIDNMIYTAVTGAEPGGNWNPNIMISCATIAKMPHPSAPAVLNPNNIARIMIMISMINNNMEESPNLCRTIFTSIFYHFNM